MSENLSGCVFATPAASRAAIADDEVTPTRTAIADDEVDVVASAITETSLSPNPAAIADDEVTPSRAAIATHEANAVASAIAQTSPFPAPIATAEANPSRVAIADDDQAAIASAIVGPSLINADQPLDPNAVTTRIGDSLRPTPTRPFKFGCPMTGPDDDATSASLSSSVESSSSLPYRTFDVSMVPKTVPDDIFSVSPLKHPDGKPMSWAEEAELAATVAAAADTIDTDTMFDIEMGQCDGAGTAAESTDDGDDDNGDKKESAPSGEQEGEGEAMEEEGEEEASSSPLLSPPQGWTEPYSIVSHRRELQDALNAAVEELPSNYTEAEMAEVYNRYVAQYTSYRDEYYRQHPDERSPDPGMQATPMLYFPTKKQRKWQDYQGVNDTWPGDRAVVIIGQPWEDLAWETYTSYTSKSHAKPWAKYVSQRRGDYLRKSDRQSFTLFEEWFWYTLRTSPEIKVSPIMTPSELTRAIEDDINGERSESFSSHLSQNKLWAKLCLNPQIEEESRLYALKEEQSDVESEASTQGGPTPVETEGAGGIATPQPSTSHPAREAAINLEKRVAELQAKLQESERLRKAEKPKAAAAKETAIAAKEKAIADRERAIAEREKTRQDRLRKATKVKEALAQKAKEAKDTKAAKDAARAARVAEQHAKAEAHAAAQKEKSSTAPPPKVEYDPGFIPQSKGGKAPKSSRKKSSTSSTGATPRKGAGGGGAAKPGTSTAAPKRQSGHQTGPAVKSGPTSGRDLPLAGGIATDPIKLMFPEWMSDRKVRSGSGGHSEAAFAHTANPALGIPNWYVQYDLHAQMGDGEPVTHYDRIRIFYDVGKEDWEVRISASEAQWRAAFCTLSQLQLDMEGHGYVPIRLEDVIRVLKRSCGVAWMGTAGPTGPEGCWSSVGGKHHQRLPPNPHLLNPLHGLNSHRRGKLARSRRFPPDSTLPTWESGVAPLGRS